MELEAAIRARRMVRAYDPDRPVPLRTLDTLLAAAIRAPSAGFSQGWDFVVLSTPEERAGFWAVTADPDVEPDSWLLGMRTAPALIVCLSDRERYLDRYAEADKGWTDRDQSRWPVPYWDVDTGMAAMLILLTAVDQSLGACFFGVPPAVCPALLEHLAAPATRHVVGVISVGHPAPDRRSPSLRRGRRSVADVAHCGRYGVAWQDHAQNQAE